MVGRVPTAERRRQIVEAAFRLVVAEGLDGMSLRKISDESGMNIGSVRHYFDGHLDLLAAAAEEAADRMDRRLSEHPIDGLRGLRGAEALDALQGLVETVLPLDDARRDEAVVVLELIMASRTRPVFRAMSERMARDLSAVLHDALDALGVPDATIATAQLTAMIGGLTVDAVTPHGALAPDRVRTVLRAHLLLLLPGAPRP